MNKKQFLLLIYVLGFATISFASNPDSGCQCIFYRRIILLNNWNNEPSQLHYGWECRHSHSLICSSSIACCCFRIERSVQIAPLTRSASSIESIQMESVRSASPIERDNINIPVNNPDPD